MEQPKVSIIIPIYNAEKYLYRCMESITKQTLREIEVVAVNDGSQDESLRIVREYEKQDNRVVIINQINQGVSAARNRGIKQATGEYIMFVDADDWIDLETCEQAVQSIEKNNGDIVFWGYQREYETTSLPKVLFNTDKIFDEVESKMLHRRFIGLIDTELNNPEQSDAITPVWGKLYKKKVITANQIEFIDLKTIGTCEDGLFNLYYFKHVKRAIYIDQVFSHYYKANESAFTKTYKNDLFDAYQGMLSMIEGYIEENKLSEEYREALNNRRCMSLIGIGLTECIASNPKTHKQRIIFINHIIKSENYKIAYKQMNLTYLPVHWKIFFGCAKYGCATGVYILLQVINYIISR